MGTDGGMFDKAKGKFEEVAGKVTGDHKMEAEGRFDQVKGAAKDLAEDAKAGLEVAADKIKDVLHRD